MEMCKTLELTCLTCLKGEMIKKYEDGSWYECNNRGCEGDSDDVVGGFAYPTLRRGTLCEEYTPVYNLNVSGLNAGQEIEFLTVRKTRKKATVVHVDYKGNKMIIQDIDTQKVRIVVDNSVIDDAYGALFSDNKIECAGWWNRRIKIL